MYPSEIHEVGRWKAITLLALTIAAIAAFALYLLCNFDRNPLMIVLPCPANDLEAIRVPVVLPPGSYCLQLGFRNDYLDQIEEAHLTGFISLYRGMEVLVVREVDERLTADRTATLRDEAAEHARIAESSRNTRWNLPFPWTTILPDTVSVPLFPLFKIEESNTLLEIEVLLENSEKTKSGSERAEGDVFVRIDRFFDAI